MRSRRRAIVRRSSRRSRPMRWGGSRRSELRTHGPSSPEIAYAMIDLHSHLLPGVDDGSRSIESSVAVLEKFAAEGVELVVLTPHLNVSRADEAPYERHLEILT